MSARKKSKRETRSSAAEKRPLPEVRRSLNPLPAEAVGPRLLVLLQAEKVIKECNLKSKKESAVGWSFAEVCALAADALGERYLRPEEAKIVQRLRKNRTEKEIERIQGCAKLKQIVEKDGRTHIPSDLYQACLIVGLGSGNVPEEQLKHQTETAWLTSKVAQQLRVDPTIVDERAFEYAKRRVKARYEEHIANQEKRGCVKPEKRSSEQVKLSHQELLQLIFGANVEPGLVSGSTLSAVERRALLKAGLPLPSTKMAGRPGSRRAEGVKRDSHKQTGLNRLPGFVSDPLGESDG